MSEENFCNTSGGDAISPIFQSWTHSSGKVTLWGLSPLVPLPRCSAQLSGFGSSGPVKLMGLNLRSGVFFVCLFVFFFFRERGKKEHSFPSSPKQKGRRTPDCRLSGSQIRNQDALTERAWEDQTPHRDSILLEVLCHDSLPSSLTEKGSLSVCYEKLYCVTSVTF